MSHEVIEFEVRYLGAKKLYVDPHASPKTTLLYEKPKVLDFFGLKETTADQAGGKVYVFTQGNKPITDLSVTLGQLAHGARELKLNLVEQLVQG